MGFIYQHLATIMFEAKMISIAKLAIESLVTLYFIVAIIVQVAIIAVIIQVMFIKQAFISIIVVTAIIEAELIIAAEVQAWEALLKLQINIL